MTAFRISLVAAALAASVALAPQQTVLALRFGSAVTGQGRTIRDAVIVVTGDRITRVGSGAGAVPSGADVIDLHQYTAIPGLIDMHTHMTYFWDGAPDTTPLNQPRRQAADTARVSALNARRTLDTGVTTVRDLGAAGGADYMMRDQIAAGTMVGPRMFVAGSGISASRGGGPAADAMAGLVDARVKGGSDWIKVYASRGTYNSVDTTQTLTYEQIKAVVDAAHAATKPVAVHSYGASGVKDAVRAGADTIEHGIELDDETLTMMVKQKTVWVPTIDHNRYYVDAKEEFKVPEDTIPPLQEYIQKNLESAARAFKAGVTLEMGSDAVFSMFGQNTRELAWFVKAGMTPEQALATATTSPAKTLGHANDLGALAPNYFADIVAVEGDPLKDIDVVISKVRWVMKGGQVVVKLASPTMKERAK
jgi:imidazolonepropionase-like amidohydrolase